MQKEAMVVAAGVDRFQGPHLTSASAAANAGPASGFERLRQLPVHLFHPLAAPGRDVYLHGLMEIFQMARGSHGLIERAVLVDAMEGVLSREGALEQTDDLLDHEPQYGVDESDPVDIRRRARAGAMVRYFERCGWIRTEMQSDQSAQVMLFDHSFRLLDALSQYAGAASAPLQGIVCSIHDLLAAAAKGDNAEVRVQEAARQCEQLLMALRELEHNIGAHMEKLLLEPDVPSILRRLLHRYGAEVIDSGYHKLKTTDHVSRYRPAMFEALASLADSFGIRASQAPSAGSRSDAERQTVHEQIHFLHDAFEGLDHKIGRIDDRHKLFVDAAVRRVEKLVMGSTTVSGLLQSILSKFIQQFFGSSVQGDGADGIDSAEGPQVSESLSEKHSNARNLPWQHLLDIFSLALVDSSSLARPRKESQRFVPVIEKVKRPSAQKIAKARKETQQQLLRAMGKHRMAQLVDMLLGQETSKRASELPLDSADQIALLIYLRSHGDGSLGYTVRDVQPRLWIMRGEIGFYDFFIEQREAKAAGSARKTGPETAPWSEEWRI